MNSKERVKRAFHFQKPDRVPMSCINLKTDFFPVTAYPPRSWQPKGKYPPHVQGGVNSIAKWTFRTFVYRWKRKYRKKAEFPKKYWKQPHLSVDEWGIIWKASGTKSNDITRGHPHFGPLQDSWDFLEEYEIPDVSNKSRFRFIRTPVWKLLGRKRYTLGELAPNGFFNLCSQLRGFNNFLIDLARKPKQVNKLTEKIFPYYITLIKKYKQYYPSLDSVIVADDLGTQKSPFISPRLFKKYFKDPYKRIINLAHDLELDFILHSCGQIFELMPDIIDAGVDVFEFDSPHMVGVKNLRNFAKDQKVAFWLSSNIQSTYTLGTPEDVKEEIKTYIKEVGNNKGGLAIYEYPANTALGTPRENIIAQREAVEKWGKYNETGIIEWLAKSS
ncbi:MAG: hypothetical protein GF317_10945 [Candidatus Lokiarchaeota archaeon]|nr:hypothetical protein [Candidatus Lokiarchaeota archaeon]MBD3200179.1 hypothetical protein [Candidatus Lokiarchaeota archaeon]